MADDTPNQAGTANKKTAHQKPFVKLKKPFWKSYLNPVKDVLHVEFNEKIKEFYIADITDKVIIRHTPTAQVATVSMLNYPTGVHFLKIPHGEQWQTDRFILNR